MPNFIHLTRLFIDHYGLLALFVLLTLEEAGVWLPLPGDLVIMYFGFQAAKAPHPLLAALPALLAITAAVLCGSITLYAVVRRFRWILQRYGRFLRLDERRLAWMEQWLVRRGRWVIIPGRLIPGLRIPTTVASGAFNLPLRAFVPSVAVAGAIWGIIYLFLGAAGKAILAALRDLRPDDFSDWGIVGLAMLALALSALFLHQRQSRAQR